MIDSGTWNSSNELLEEAETNILAAADCDYNGYFIEISNNIQIRTIKFGNHDDKEKTPLVLVHGYAAALGFFILNYKELSKNRNVYAIDMIGFGRSSRPKFPDDPLQAEDMFIDSIEEWRIAQGLKKINLVGHSFGGYLVGLYALKFPEHLHHLIFADPWGFPVMPDPDDVNISGWKLALLKTLSNVNPFSIIRAAGRLGPSLIRTLRGDIPDKYQHKFQDGDTTVSEYIYYCIAQEPSGETAFNNISQYLGYSKNPLITRIKELDPNILVTVLYGENSWMMNLFDFEELGEVLSDQCYYDLKLIYNAGHHIYSDNDRQFNKYVNDACDAEISDFEENIVLKKVKQFSIESYEMIPAVPAI